MKQKKELKLKKIFEKEVEEETREVLLTREETDLKRYEALYQELNDLGITRISDLENLIANTKKVIK